MKRTIKAIPYPLAVDAGLGQFKVEEDYEAHVRQLILQVLYTDPGERINRPDFGCGIRRMVFEPNHVASASLTQVAIVQALEKWLGTAIKVENVKAVANEEKLEILVQYVLKATQERKFLNAEVAL